MVPYYSIRANSKLAEFTNSSDCLIEGSQAVARPRLVKQYSTSRTNRHTDARQGVYARPGRPCEAFCAPDSSPCLNRQTRLFLSVLDQSADATAIQTQASPIDLLTVTAFCKAERADRLSFLSTIQLTFSRLGSGSAHTDQMRNPATPRCPMGATAP